MIKITAEILTASFWTGVLNVLNKVWPILAALLLFGIVIFIHEFGHFSFAKMFGIKVNEFAIGFGPKIFSKRGKKTDYSLRLLPLGGYCAMEGEDAESSDENAFGNKSIIKRILVLRSATASTALTVGEPLRRRTFRICLQAHRMRRSI